jgi:tetratricopeptide (TPR) repeat protein
MFDIQRDYDAASALDIVGEKARFEQLLAVDPALALAEMQLALDRADLAATLGGGQALALTGLLTEQHLPGLAAAYASENQFPEAAAWWRKVIASRPEPAFHFALAEALAAKGDMDEALDAARQAASLSPGNPKLTNLARRLKFIQQHDSQAPDWKHLRLLIDWSLLIGARSNAERYLSKLALAPPPGEPTTDEALGIIDAALSLGRLDLVEALVDGPLQALPVDNDAVRTLLIRVAEARGPTEADLERTAAYVAESNQGSSKPEAEVGARRLRYFAAEAYASAGHWRDAIALLAALGTEDSRDHVALTALQKCVGEAVLSQVDFAWAPPRPPRIFNLLPYYNERELLDLRMDEMGDWVDHFVIVEATETFTGKSKPLNFANERSRLDARGGQILNVGVEFPDYAGAAWTRDFYQRDMAITALVGRLRPDDVILITDADEIVDRRALEGFWPNLANLRMQTSKLFFNYAAKSGNSHANRRSGAICRGSHLARFGCSYIRTALSSARKQWESVPRAGWHFTSLGDAAFVAEKLASYAHQEAGKIAYRDLSAVDQMLSNIVQGKEEPGWEITALDSRFPAYLTKHKERLAPLILNSAVDN